MTIQIHTFELQILKFNLQHITTAVVTSLLASTSMVLSPVAHGLEVKISPNTPQLGDTMSVIIDMEDHNNNTLPVVRKDGKNYPVFTLAPKKYRALIPTTPLDQPGKKLIQVISDRKEQQVSISIKSRKFPTQRITLRGNKAGLRATAQELNRVREFKALQTAKKFWHGPFLRPNRGRVSTIYGVRRYYNGKFAKGYFHRGVDYAGASGSAIIAPAAGRVALVGTVSQGFRVHGNTVGIDHGQGVVSIFLHLNRINVKEGDMVKPGELIGTVGSTGASTGPHLHWGLYVNGKAVSPVPWRYSSID
ncbi:MAG: M23 family metallopeptidase [Richelia sp.]|nr:M23 family metallopeptidase [Richelia sp.]